MFQKGQSGNPAGPAKGTRHKITLLAEKLMAADAENIVAAVVTAARNGDMTAAKIILDRIAPARRDSPAPFNLPKIESAASAAAAGAAILSAVADGSLTPNEGGEISKLIEGFVRTLGASEFEMRLRALEAAAGDKP
jgi:Family of unknown function (DUF5681)